MKQPKTLQEVCAAAGEQESSYAIPTQGTPQEMRDAYYKRLELYERVFNEGENCNMGNPGKPRWSVWVNIIADDSRPFGFRLSFDVYDYDASSSLLGARPEFHDKETAVYVFKTFQQDYEGWMYYYNLSKQKIRKPMEWIKTIADLCKAAGVKEADYAIPENGSAKVMADAYWGQLMLMERVFNPKGWNADIADTEQAKYWTYADVIKDTSRPFGFRLSFLACACARSSSYLCARPEFHNKETAIYVFKTFTAVYEGWMHYTYLSKKQNQPA